MSYAAATLPRNSVGPQQLRKNAVSSPKVKDRSLRARDFARGQLPAGRTGPTGPKGATGLRGLAGSTGPRGPSDAYYAWDVGGDGTKSKTLALPTGSYVVTAKESVICNEIHPCSSPSFTYCTLDRGPGSVFAQEEDTSYAWVPADTTTAEGKTATIANEIAVDLPSGGTISYSCTASSGAGNYEQKIIAVRVASLH